MADNVDPRTGELVTANYGWTKPTVGASTDNWGGYLNADLDGIDSTVKSVSNVANAAYPASNPSGYQTAAQVTAAAPVASSTAPLMDGVAAVGTGTTWARADHVHPSDTHAMGDNRIINGDMRIDQRNNGASGTATSVYTIDRWQYNATQASKGNWQRAIFSAYGFPYALFFGSTSAYTPLASDTFYFQQKIEADMVSDFQWGTAAAQSVTLSFYALSSLTGTFSGSIRNDTNTRSYPFTFSLPTASTATRISITIPGDAAGTWVMSGAATSVLVGFDLGAGATYRGPAGAWAGTQYNGATGAVSVVGTNGATFYVTGVKLEIGSVATPYNRQSMAKSIADCQRYYQKLGGDVGLSLLFQGYVAAAGNSISSTIGISAMRAAPTATRVGTWTNVTNLASYTLSAGLSTLGVQMNATAAGQTTMFATAADTITLSAEL